MVNAETVTPRLLVSMVFALVLATAVDVSADATHSGTIFINILVSPLRIFAPQAGTTQTVMLTVCSTNSVLRVNVDGQATTLLADPGNCVTGTMQVASEITLSQLGGASGTVTYSVSADLASTKK